MALSEKSKWLGSILLLIGVTLNILNNPELQEYVYPWNLIVNLFGCTFLLIAALSQRDKPYIILNAILGIGYVLGVINAFYPISDIINFFLELWIHMDHINIHIAEWTGLPLH